MCSEGLPRVPGAPARPVDGTTRPSPDRNAGGNIDICYVQDVDARDERSVPTTLQPMLMRLCTGEDASTTTIQWMEEYHEIPCGVAFVVSDGRMYLWGRVPLFWWMGVPGQSIRHPSTRPVPVPGSAAAQPGILRPRHLPEGARTGLLEAQVAQLPISRRQRYHASVPNVGLTVDCPLCCEDIDDDRVVYLHPCGHRACVACATEYLAFCHLCDYAPIG